MNWKLFILQSLINEVIFIAQALIAQTNLPSGIKAAVEQFIVSAQAVIIAVQSGQ